MTERTVRDALYILSPTGLGTLAAHLEKSITVNREREIMEARAIVESLLNTGAVETRDVGTVKLFALRGCWV